MYPVHTRRTPETAPDIERCASEKIPNVTASSTGTPLFELTCAEIRTTCNSITATKRMPVRCRRSITAIWWALAYRPRAPSASRRAQASAAPDRSTLVNGDLPQEIEIRQHLPGAEHNR